MMISEVDKYLIDGCMRCEYGGTPDCKVNDWHRELKTLRMIVLETGLIEELKWGVPCYTYNKKNVLTVSALKNVATIGFFKGALLEDPHNLLQKPGPNSQPARYIKFTSVDQIIEVEHFLKEYIQNAIEVEKAGLQVKFKKNPEPIPNELQQKLDDDPVFKSAFETLTPGRQRGYIIYFSQPKKPETRIGRIEKSVPNILNGVGLHDKYTSGKK